MDKQTDAFPQRKGLPHSVPPWVKPGALYFLTLCGEPRGQDQFCRPETAAKLFQTVAHRQAAGVWFVRLMVLMPDHVHALVAVAPDRQLVPTVRLWKAYTARRHGLHWQRDFFEHRVRNAETWEEKARYIRQNPVRAGLVGDEKDWPYVWEPEI